MPTVWYVKDGRRPDTQRGEGIRLTFEEIRSAFGSYKPTFLSTEPPEFNPEKPSRYPVRVVIEVEGKDGTNDNFPKPGFYILSDLSPDKAHELLTKHRTKK